MEKVNVEIWSDFACPWCWIAKRRFEKAVASLAGSIDVSIIPRAYRLAKGMEPIDFKEAIQNKFRNIAATEQMMSMVFEYGSVEGLKYNFSTMQFGDTSNAHTIVKHIASNKDRGLAVERIFKAYTTDGINIFDRRVLLTLVKGWGFFKGTLDFDSPQIALEISQDELKANQVSSGVPLFIFNGDTHLSGACEVFEFENALIRAAKNAPDHVEEFTAPSCDINGCAS